MNRNRCLVGHGLKQSQIALGERDSVRAVGQRNDPEHFVSEPHGNHEQGADLQEGVAVGRHARIDFRVGDDHSASDRGDGADQPFADSDRPGFDERFKLLRAGQDVSGADLIRIIERGKDAGNGAREQTRFVGIEQVDGTAGGLAGFCGEEENALDQFIGLNVIGGGEHFADVVDEFENHFAFRTHYAVLISQLLYLPDAVNEVNQQGRFDQKGQRDRQNAGGRGGHGLISSADRHRFSDIR